MLQMFSCSGNVGGHPFLTHQTLKPAVAFFVFSGIVVSVRYCHAHILFHLLKTCHKRNKLFHLELFSNFPCSFLKDAPLCHKDNSDLIQYSYRHHMYIFCSTSTYYPDVQECHQCLLCCCHCLAAYDLHGLLIEEEISKTWSELVSC